MRKRTERTKRTKALILALCAAVLVTATPIVPATTASASPYDVTATAGDFTGLYETADGWTYLEDGFAVDVTCFIKTDAGWVYVKHGRARTDYTGFAEGEINGETGKWYVTDGIADPERTGIFDGLVVENGRASDFTGFFESDGLWYVTDGIVQDAFTGFAADGDLYRYVRDGLFAADLTDLVSSTLNGEDGLWFVRDGLWDRTAEGIVKYGDSYVCVKDGRKSGATCIVKAEIGGVAASWYVQDGTVETGYTGTVTVDGTTYDVVDGKATVHAEPETARNTDSGNTNSGNTKSGNTNSGNTNSGSTKSGNTNSGNTNSGSTSTAKERAGIFVAVKGASSSRAKTADENLTKVPKWMRDKFVELGGVAEVTGEDIGKKWGVSISNIAGYTWGYYGGSSTTIDLKNADDAVTAPIVIHEFGHWFDLYAGTESCRASGTSAWKNAYQSEINTFYKTLSGNKSEENAAEYFADAFSAYYRSSSDRATFKKNCPKMYSYMESLIAEAKSR